MSNFHKNCENKGKTLKMSCVRCHFMKVKFIFSSYHKKFSLVLLHV